MLNEIAPHIFHNDMSWDVAKDNDYILVFDKNMVLLKVENQQISIPRVSEVKTRNDIDMNKLEYLFAIDDTAYYLLRNVQMKAFSYHSADFEYHTVQIFRELPSQVNAFTIITAFQICRWMEKHKYCGCCGSKTTKSNKERALVCHECGNTIYPTIAPAVAVAIINDDKILLARNAYGTFRKFALIAGFVELGESFEETVKREVKEEVGLQIKNIRYYKSQPWASSDNEMIGFFVDLDGDDKVTLQEEEIAEARWFSREELDDNLSQISLSYEMIEKFRINEYPR